MSTTDNEKKPDSASAREAPLPDSDSPSSLAPSNASTAAAQDQEREYPHGVKLLLIMVALCLAVFCIALDNTIVATAIPRITDEFHALQDIGWYGSAYLLTTCAFQLFFGKLYTLFSVKLVFLTALAIFEIGSLVCGVAPNSVALICGRAVAGMGSAGLFSGALVIIAYSTTIVKRPVYTSFAGSMYGLASVLGPLLGGAFTSRVTWRWCFYINLPIGGVTAVIIIFFLHIKTETKRQGSGPLALIWGLDPIGTVLFVASIICLLLALQWGGSTYAWSDGRIIALLVVFVVALIGFGAVQVWLGEIATVPPRLFLKRTVAFASVFAFFLGAAFFILVYFIPVWFQAIDGVDAFTSGIHSIPLVLTTTVAIIISGIATTKYGYYMPWVLACTVVTSVGAGLIYTWNPSTTEGQWIGYQVVFGFGCGLAFQLPQIAAQAVLSLQDVAVGVAITFFFQVFGGAIFVSAGNNVLTSTLIRNIAALNIPGIDPRGLASVGATQLRGLIPSQYFGAVVEAYNGALVKVFELALIVSCLTALGAAGMEWKNIKKAEGEKIRQGEVSIEGQA